MARGNYGALRPTSASPKRRRNRFEKWGHDRVLYDAVLAIRMVRPQVIMSTFVGGVTDGHGQHQVAGEIAQEAFKAAADPNVFPEQLRPVKDGGAGFEPWQPLAVYSRTPFAPITNGQMLDYATGKWAPARFHNYLTGEWIEGTLPADVTIPVGKWDPVLGRTYVQIAREGWGEQKSQYGGADPALSAPGFFELSLVGGCAIGRRGRRGKRRYKPVLESRRSTLTPASRAWRGWPATRRPSGSPMAWPKFRADLETFTADCKNQSGVDAAHRLAPIYRQTLDLYARVKASDLDAEAKAGLDFELGEKIDQFQTALKDLLGLDLVAFTASGGQWPGPRGRGASADETARSVWPGEDFACACILQTAWAASVSSRVWLEAATARHGRSKTPADRSTHNKPPASATDRSFHVHVPDDAAPTEPYFTRPTTEQPYYDISNEAWRERSFAPYPLAAWAEFTFDGVPIRLGMVVQTLARVTGVGGVYQPLVVTPAIGVRVEPEARILPLDGSPLPVQRHGSRRARRRRNRRSEAARRLARRSRAARIPPESRGRHRAARVFGYSWPATSPRAHTRSRPMAHVGEKDYSIGWQSIGYTGFASL